MKYKFEYNYTIDIQDCKLNTILAVFNEMKDEVIEKIIQSKEKQLENLIYSPLQYLPRDLLVEEHLT